MSGFARQHRAAPLHRRYVLGRARLTSLARTWSSREKDSSITAVSPIDERSIGLACDEHLQHLGLLVPWIVAPGESGTVSWNAAAWLRA